jgi:hypothetical protein
MAAHAVAALSERETRVGIRRLLRVAVCRAANQHPRNPQLAQSNTERHVVSAGFNFARCATV